MVRSMNPANRNRAISWDLCVFLAGTAVGLFLLVGACDRAAGQVAPAAAAQAAKASAQPGQKRRHSRVPKRRHNPRRKRPQSRARPSPQPPPRSPPNPPSRRQPPCRPRRPAPARMGRKPKRNRRRRRKTSICGPKTDGTSSARTTARKRVSAAASTSCPSSCCTAGKGKAANTPTWRWFCSRGALRRIVPDLRGHGRSVSRKKPNGEDEVVKVNDLTPQDLEGMNLDVETVKKVLVEKNNKAELNIEMLTVIAAEVGTIVAVNWAALDWSWPTTSAYKQGQERQGPGAADSPADLQTPELQQGAGDPGHQPAAVDHAGGGRGQQQLGDFSEAKRIHSRLERLRPRGEGGRRAETGLVPDRGPDTAAGHQAARPSLESQRRHHDVSRLASVEEVGGLPLGGAQEPLGQATEFPVAGSRTRPPADLSVSRRQADRHVRAT